MFCELRVSVSLLQSQLAFKCSGMAALQVLQLLSCQPRRWVQGSLEKIILQTLWHAQDQTSCRMLLSSLGMMSGSFSNCCYRYVLLNNNYQYYQRLIVLPKTVQDTTAGSVNDFLKHHLSFELLLSNCAVKTLMGQKASGDDFFFPPKHRDLVVYGLKIWNSFFFCLSEVLALILLAKIQFR